MGRKVVEIDIQPPEYRLIHGVTMIDGRPYMDKVSEERYVFNDPELNWYYNTETKAIELRSNTN